MRAVEADSRVQFTVATPDGFVDLDEALTFYGVANMTDRYPIVGFGSNACPGQLYEKFSEAQDKKGDITNGADRKIVPTLRGSVNDVAAAYSSKLGIYGYIFAELIAVRGAQTDVFVNFLSRGQLARMIRSEAQYTLCDIGEVALDGLPQRIPAYGFVGKNDVLLNENGKPILIDSVTTRGADLPALSEVQVLEMLARDFGALLDRRYTNAPVFANSAANIMALMSYRVEYLRRNDTGRTKYKNHPAGNQQPDELVGPALQQILQAAGRTSTAKLLDDIPNDRQDITPRTFGELYPKIQR